MKKILFCQFSSDFLNKNCKKDISTLYYESIYKLKEKDGYYKSKYFWEIPLWISEISYALKNYNKNLFIIKDIEQDVKKLNDFDGNYILFSVLDINKKYILELIKNYKGRSKFLIGGYIDFKDFRKLKNVIILNSVKNLCDYLKINYNYGLDYTLFKNYKTIPRLTLSKGCLNKCKFCTVKKNLIEFSLKDIIRQAMSYKKLNFKLVYLNDKTFGQCENYILLEKAYKIIKKYNKKFNGFIIQTTASKMLDKNFAHNLKKLNIKIVELGIETYNKNILKNLRKPQNLITINEAVKTLKKLKIKMIGNFMIGIINENRSSYNNTLNFISENIKNFFILNIYNLAVYLESELGKELKIKNINDSNENILTKSFYNKSQLKNNKYFYNSIYTLGLKILKNKGG